MQIVPHVLMILLIARSRLENNSLNLDTLPTESGYSNALYLYTVLGLCYRVAIVNNENCISVVVVYINPTLKPGRITPISDMTHVQSLASRVKKLLINVIRLTTILLTQLNTVNTNFTLKGVSSKTSDIY